MDNNNYLTEHSGTSRFLSLYEFHRSLSSFVVTILLLTAQGQAAAETKTEMLWSAFKTTTQLDGAPVFVPGADVEIPADKRIIFDGTEADVIKRLFIRGEFVCSPGARTLKAEGIAVVGSTALFQCGTPAIPRTEKFTIQLHGHSVFTDAELLPDMCTTTSS